MGGRGGVDVGDVWTCTKRGVKRDVPVQFIDETLFGREVGSVGEYIRQPEKSTLWGIK